MINIYHTLLIFKDEVSLGDSVWVENQMDEEMLRFL